MPRAILAIRNYPAALLMAALLFLASLVLAAGSMGYIGGDDGGAGIGGTGKSGLGGGSGLGGTGSPSPFFGAGTDTTESTEADDFIEEENSLDAIDRAMRRVDGQRRLSAPDPLYAVDRPETPAWREELLDTDGNVPDTQRLRELAGRAVRDRGPSVLDIRIELEQPVPTGSNTIADRIEPYSLAHDSRPVSAGGSEENGDGILLEPVDAPSQVARQQEEDPAGVDEEERLSTERIQRPELPPFQRIRPVQRATALPERPQPMHI